MGRLPYIINSCERGGGQNNIFNDRDNAQTIDNINRGRLALFRNNFEVSPVKHDFMIITILKIIL